MGARRDARECALQILYQWDLRRDDPRALVRTFWDARAGGGEVREFADRLAFSTIENLGAIDAIIQRHAVRWRLDRMETADRNVLRIAVQELMHERETPPAVVIDEAIEVARKFSKSDSGEFVNGVLDSIRRELDAAPPLRATHGQRPAHGETDHG